MTWAVYFWGEDTLAEDWLFQGTLTECAEFIGTRSDLCIMLAE